MGEYVIVRPDEPDARSPGGIYLPDSAKRPQSTGIVLAVGREVDPLSALSVGDRVFYYRGANHFDVRLSDHRFVAVHQDCVFARIRPAVPDGVPADL